MERYNERIAVIGLGKLGLPLAVTWARRGFQTIGVDNDPNVIQAIEDGLPQTNEPGLRDALQSVWRNTFRMDTLENAVHNADIIFIMVTTPSDALHPGFSLEYMLTVCHDIGMALRTKTGDCLIVVSSTVMPGSCNGIIRSTIEDVSGKAMGNGWDLVHCPEFVALGSLIRNYLEPDLVVIGTEDIEVAYRMECLYRKYCLNTPAIVHMNLVNAELTKLALNCYVATKITFGNQLGALCERIPGANVDDPVQAMYCDHRVGQGYMAGAVAYGGPCFPRDTLALPHAARQFGGSLPLVELVHELNQREHDRLYDKIMRCCANHLGAMVGILGLSFKVGVKSLLGSAGAILAERLSAQGVISTYDPLFNVSPHAAASAQACVNISDVVVIATPWPEFAQLQFLDGQDVIDCWRLLDADTVTAQGANYIPFGVWYAQRPDE